jgi:hypothetical protein
MRDIHIEPLVGGDSKLKGGERISLDCMLLPDI